MAESIQYTNRRGKIYYLHAAATRAGVTRYVMTSEAEGALTELPQGYAITENVNGLVSIGHIKAKLIKDTELATVENELQELRLAHYRCEAKDVYLTVYESVHRTDELSPVFQKMGFRTESLTEILAEIVDKGQFEPVMRFRLFDKKKRIFEIQRMTYRGEGGWMSLHTFGSLKDLARDYLRHLGKDSFYELM